MKVYLTAWAMLFRDIYVGTFKFLFSGLWILIYGGTKNILSEYKRLSLKNKIKVSAIWLPPILLCLYILIIDLNHITNMGPAVVCAIIVIFSILFFISRITVELIHALIAALMFLHNKTMGPYIKKAKLTINGPEKETETEVTQ